MPDNDENETARDELEDKRPLVACITVGIFQENCYLYACPVTREAVIIDPGDEAPRILSQIEEVGFIPKYILNTHGHIDHICAIDEVTGIMVGASTAIGRSAEREHDHVGLSRRRSELLGVVSVNSGCCGN